MDYGWAKSLKTPKYMMYDATDKIGCDFQIYYDTAWGSMNVSFGGREVYSFYKNDLDGEYLNSGHWIKMTQAMKKYQGHMIDAFLNEMPSKEASDYCSTVELKFGGRIVFVFRYNSNDKGGMLDEKGKYISGKWEKIVEDLVN